MRDLVIELLGDPSAEVRRVAFEALENQEVEADEVVLIGDSWIWRPALDLRDLARATGTIRPDEDYVVLAGDGAHIEAIMDQYNTREAGAIKVKVLIISLLHRIFDCYNS